MRKTVMPVVADTVGAEPAGPWLDLEKVARVELTSEDPAHPFEDALRPGGGGWRAGTPGRQTIRLVFDAPVHLRRLHFEVEERERERTQQVTVRWSGDGAGELVRQPYTFSPGGATRESETYEADVAGVRAVEIEMVPDVSGGDAVASLRALRVG